MPVAIGFHPYFQLTDSSRNTWTVAIAARTHWLLAPTKVPTGETEPAELPDVHELGKLAAVGGPLGEVDVEPAAVESIHKDRRSNDGQDHRGREPVVTDAHEIDVRPRQQAEHAQLFEPTLEQPEVEQEPCHV